jgi:glutamate racemase
MIGIFDSGIGGLTVVKEILDLLPEYQILYFGDTARTPYGTKSPKTVVEYALEDAEFLIARGARILVVACNTASSLATSALKERFPVPIFEVITPAVEETLRATRNNKVGIIGTRATIQSRIYEEKIRARDPRIQVFSQACPLLVPLVEEGWLAERETKTIVKRYLYPLRQKQIDTLVLGCTHYPLLKPIIRIKAGRRVKIINSSTEAARALRDFLEREAAWKDLLVRGEDHQFFVSDLTPKFQEIARTILKKEIHLQLS